MTASLRSKAHKENSKSQKNKGTAESSNGIVPQPSRQPLPMRRHKGLFVALMSVFVAWVGLMLGLYFMTVRPQRHLEPLPLPEPQSPQPQPPAATTTSPTTRALAQTLVPRRPPAT